MGKEIFYNFMLKNVVHLNLWFLYQSSAIEKTIWAKTQQNLSLVFPTKQD